MHKEEKQAILLRVYEGGEAAKLLKTPYMKVDALTKQGLITRVYASMATHNERNATFKLTAKGLEALRELLPEADTKPVNQVGSTDRAPRA